MSNIQDSMRVGDTIFISLDYPYETLDINNNEVIDLTDWNSKPYLLVYKLEDNQYESHEISFNYSSDLDVRPLDEKSLFVDFKLIKGESSNYAESFIVCKEAGDYAISIGHEIFDLALEECPDKFANVTYNLKINGEEGDNNYHIIESLNLTEELPELEFSKFGGLVLRVLE